MTTIPIGIDLGTTTSSVAIVLEGKVEVVQNEQGCRTTPSYVAFKDREPLIGTVALDQMDSNMHNTISGMKRMLGRQFRDISDSSHTCQWFQGNDMLPKVEVHWPPEDKKHFSTEQITALLISKMRDIVDMHLTSRVGDASQHCDNVVIAVPACFNSSQRQATKDAALIAGIQEKDLYLIDEPIAAALTYGFQHKSRYGQCNLLVVDIGGGKCEASIVKIAGNEWGRDETYVLKGTSGNDCFGGNDFDELLLEHCFKQYKDFLVTSHNHLSEGLSQSALKNLKFACRSIKHKLTLLHSATVDVYLDGMDYTFVITREVFEHLCSDFFTAIATLVNTAMTSAKLDQTQIDDYILIGGTTRIPDIRQRLKQLMTWKESNQSINPDEAIAFGAAIYAELLSLERRACVDSGTANYQIEAVNGCILLQNLSIDNAKVEQPRCNRFWNCEFHQAIDEMCRGICLLADNRLSAEDFAQFVTALRTFYKYDPYSRARRDRFAELSSIYKRIDPTLTNVIEKAAQQARIWTTAFSNKTCLRCTSNFNDAMIVKVTGVSPGKQPVLECSLYGIIKPIELRLNIDEDGILSVLSDDDWDEIGRMAVDCKIEKLRNAAKRALDLYVYDIGDDVKNFYHAHPLTESHRRLFTTFREAKTLIATKTFPAAFEYEEMKNTLKYTFDQVNGRTGMKV